jgi:TetR/AcrR family transcriptional regulator, tetracycline repressor protein
MPARKPDAAPLSEEAIVAVAYDVVTTDGVAAVSMRRLARDLGVTTPALYWYVDGLDTVLRRVATRLVENVLAPAAQAYAAVNTLDEWMTINLRFTNELRAVYRRYPGLARVVLRSPGVDSQEMARFPQVESLRRLGVPLPAAEKSFRIGVAWTLAYLAAETDVAPGTSDTNRLTTPQRDDLFVEGLRWMVAGMREMVDEATDDDATPPTDT